MRAPESEQSSLTIDLTSYNNASSFWDHPYFASRCESQEGSQLGIQATHQLNGLDWAPTRDGFHLPVTELPQKCPPFTGENPKLERFIPHDQLPEDLLVLDPTDVLTLKHRGSASSTQPLGPRVRFRYRRVHPKIPNEHGQRSWSPHATSSLSSNTAQLDFTNAPVLGEGDHGRVHLALLTLAGEPHPSQVAAKISYAAQSDRSMMYDEARTYALFPPHLQEDWSGYHHLSTAEFEEVGDGIFPACAVVPKFYGFYLPVYNVDRPRSRKGTAIEGVYSPILLVEHCGVPINPAQLKAEHRTTCYAFAARMHHAGFLHNSFHKRNILIQPGPLSAPPLQRSLETPSFRLIDFGRTEYWGGSQRWHRLIRSTLSKWDSTQNADWDGRETDSSDDSHDTDRLTRQEREWKRIREWLLLERRDAMNSIYGWVEKRVVWVEYQGVKRKIGFYYRPHTNTP